MKIYAPVKSTNGVYASVRFVNGVGETDNPRLIEWFRSHGYTIEKPVENHENPIEKLLEECDELSEKVTPNFEDMTPNELREWAKSNGFGGKIKNIRNKEKLIEILRG